MMPTRPARSAVGAVHERMSRWIVGRQRSAIRVVPIGHPRAWIGFDRSRRNVPARMGFALVDDARNFVVSPLAMVTPGSATDERVHAQPEYQRSSRKTLQRFAMSRTHKIISADDVSHDYVLQSASCAQRQHGGATVPTNGIGLLSRRVCSFRRRSAVLA